MNVEFIVFFLSTVEIRICIDCVGPFCGIHKKIIEAVQRRYLKYLYWKIHNTNPERGFPYDIMICDIIA